MIKKHYKIQDIENIIAELAELFNIAVETYRLALDGRDSNRSKKELLRGNVRGTVVHKYQCDFAWILYDIQCGPLCLIEDSITDAHELINHLKKISL
jgi:hypothetical protein